MVQVNWHNTMYSHIRLLLLLSLLFSDLSGSGPSCRRCPPEAGPYSLDIWPCNLTCCLPFSRMMIPVWIFLAQWPEAVAQQVLMTYGISFRLLNWPWTGSPCKFHRLLCMNSPFQNGAETAGGGFPQCFTPKLLVSGATHIRCLTSRVPAY